MIDYIKAFVLFTAVAVVSGVVVMKVAMYQGGERVEVPDLRGKHVVQALEILDETGLYMKVLRLDYSTSVAKDRIIDQSPKPGEIARERNDINVTVSRGSQSIIMPQIVGTNMEMAKRTLHTSGIEINKVVKSYSAEPKGTIRAQDIPADTALDRGDALSILLSIGGYPDYLQTPEFVGKDIGLVMEEIKQIDLRISRVLYKTSEESPKGEVILQEPEAGGRLAKNSYVELTVSEGMAEDENESATYSFLYYTVPGRDSTGRVVIWQENVNGEKEIYNRIHRRGDTISLLIEKKGKTAIKIFVDDQLTEVKRF